MQQNYQRDEPSAYGDNKYLRYLGSCEEWILTTVSRCWWAPCKVRQDRSAACLLNYPKDSSPIHLSLLCRAALMTLEFMVTRTLHSEHKTVDQRWRRFQQSSHSITGQHEESCNQHHISYIDSGGCCLSNNLVQTPHSLWSFLMLLCRISTP